MDTLKIADNFIALRIPTSKGKGKSHENLFLLGNHPKVIVLSQWFLLREGGQIHFTPHETVNHQYLAATRAATHHS